jgi:hypothetical protein
MAASFEPVKAIVEPELASAEWAIDEVKLKSSENAKRYQSKFIDNRFFFMNRASQIKCKFYIAQAIF